MSSYVTHNVCFLAVYLFMSYTLLVYLERGKIINKCIEK